MSLTQHGAFSVAFYFPGTQKLCRFVRGSKTPGHGFPTSNRGLWQENTQFSVTYSATVTLLLKCKCFDLHLIRSVKDAELSKFSRFRTSVLY